jgi:hypothetical protein
MEIDAGESDQSCADTTVNLPCARASALDAPTLTS